MNIIERYSNETQKNEQYQLIEILEEVEIKNESFEVVHEYYQRLSDQELFEPFDNPDKNLNKDYALYRKKHALLTSMEIKEIRQKYGLSVRDFARVLGISYTNLSSIENGSIQAGYIDSLLRLVNDPYAFLEMVEGKESSYLAKLMRELIPRLREQVVATYPQYKKIALQLKAEVSQ